MGLQIFFRLNKKSIIVLVYIASLKYLNLIHNKLDQMGFNLIIP
jgi:hypothetical protein